MSKRPARSQITQLRPSESDSDPENDYANDNVGLNYSNIKSNGFQGNKDSVLDSSLLLKREITRPTRPSERFKKAREQVVLPKASNPFLKSEKPQFFDFSDSSRAASYQRLNNNVIGESGPVQKPQNTAFAPLPSFLPQPTETKPISSTKEGQSFFEQENSSKFDSSLHRHGLNYHFLQHLTNLYATSPQNKNAILEAISKYEKYSKEISEKENSCDKEMKMFNFTSAPIKLPEDPKISPPLNPDQQSIHFQNTHSISENPMKPVFSFSVPSQPPITKSANLNQETVAFDKSVFSKITLPPLEARKSSTYFQENDKNKPLSGTMSNVASSTTEQFPNTLISSQHNANVVNLVSSFNATENPITVANFPDEKSTMKFEYAAPTLVQSSKFSQPTKNVPQNVAQDPILISDEESDNAPHYTDTDMFYQDHAMNDNELEDGSIDENAYTVEEVNSGSATGIKGSDYISTDENESLADGPVAGTKIVDNISPEENSPNLITSHQQSPQKENNVNNMLIPPFALQKNNLEPLSTGTSNLEPVSKISNEPVAPFSFSFRPAADAAPLFPFEFAQKSKETNNNTFSSFSFSSSKDSTTSNVQSFPEPKKFPTASIGNDVKFPFTFGTKSTTSESSSLVTSRADTTSKLSSFQDQVDEGTGKAENLTQPKSSSFIAPLLFNDTDNKIVANGSLSSFGNTAATSSDAFKPAPFSFGSNLFNSSANGTAQTPAFSFGSSKTPFTGFNFGLPSESNKKDEAKAEKYNLDMKENDSDAAEEENDQEPHPVVQPVVADPMIPGPGEENDKVLFGLLGKLYRKSANSWIPLGTVTARVLSSMSESAEPSFRFIVRLATDPLLKILIHFKLLKQWKCVLMTGEKGNGLSFLVPNSSLSSSYEHLEAGKSSTEALTASSESSPFSQYLLRTKDLQDAKNLHAVIVSCVDELKNRP